MASATQDVAVDAWRIDVADEQTPVELLSAVYQFGYRIASIVGGALALVLAARMSWSLVYLIMAALIGILILVTLRAPDTERPSAGVLHGALAEPGALEPRARLVALGIVGVSWAWAILQHRPFHDLDADHRAGREAAIGGRLHQALWAVDHHRDGDRAADRRRGHQLAAQPPPLCADQDGHRITRRRGRPPITFTWPWSHRLSELAGRLGWGVLIVLGLILTYTLCYNIWSSFAFPFYLDFLHYSKDEVAFASKIFGIFMTMVGISLGGYLFLRIGRIPTILIGAILPVFGNFVYADLAEGGGRIDMVGHVLFLDRLATALGSDERMTRLLLAISYENISTGIAGAAFVAYLVGHRQQELHRRAICLAVVADLPDRVAGARHRRRGVRHLRLCDRVPLDRRRRCVRHPVRRSRGDAGCRVGRRERADTAAHRRSTRLVGQLDRWRRGPGRRGRASRR